MQATDFEFKHRFWVIGALFWIAFGSYSFDQQNAGAAIVETIGRRAGINPPAWDYHGIFALGALFCITAALLRTWATSYLNSEVMVDRHLHTDRLVADGPYRYVRNPLYLGNMLLAIGFAVMASRIGFFVLIAGMFVFCYRLILREEAGIRVSQGDIYRAYCAAVPRLLPSLRPKLPSSGATPRWSDGFLGEAFMWTMAASVLVFAVTLQIELFFIVLGFSFVVYAVCLTIIQSRRKKSAS